MKKQEENPIIAHKTKGSKLTLSFRNEMITIPASPTQYSMF